MSADTPNALLNPTPKDFPFDDDYPLEDNYDDLLRDELAYANIDWDELDPDEVNQHDATLTLSPQAILDLDPEPLNDFQRWAVARRARQHGNLNTFFKVCALILSTPADAQSVNLSYPDLRVEYARSLATAERFDDALKEAEAYRATAGAQPNLFATLRGLILLTRGEDEEGLKTLLDAVTMSEQDEPELAVHITEDLLASDLNVAARSFLDRVIPMILDRGDHDQLDELNFLLTRCAAA